MIKKDKKNNKNSDHDDNENYTSMTKIIRKKKCNELKIKYCIPYLHNANVGDTYAATLANSGLAAPKLFPTRVDAATWKLSR